MPENNTLLSLSPTRATSSIGWHHCGGPYDDPYIELIVDPTDAVPKRWLTAIPSPFARLHLFDAAFHFVSEREDGTVQHVGRSVFHRAVSECLDVLELMFAWSSHSTSVTLARWTPSQDLLSLENSRIEGQQLLASVLKLFLEEDKETAHFDQQPSFLLLLVDNSIIATSSPLTLFISSPNGAKIAESHGLVNPSTRRPYFSDILQLHERPADFQLYLHWLFLANETLAQTCLNMHKYLKQSVELLRVTNRELAAKISRLENGRVTELEGSPEPLADDEGHPIVVLGAQLYQRPRTLLIERLKSSPLVIRSKRATGSALPPLVLDRHHSSLGMHDGATVIPDVGNTPLDERVLPDMRVKYPFVVADDFIEDRIIRLPYKLNSEKFYAPRSDGFKAEDEWSFLPPLKRSFFDYFDPIDVSTMTTLSRVGNGDSVRFEIRVPVQGRSVTFSRTFYESPQMEKAGMVVKAQFNCAIFPFVVVPDRKDLCDRYWVMLVDAELEPTVRNIDCFDLQFLSWSNGRLAEIASDEQAQQFSARTRRSNKSDQAGSTYFEIYGGHFDAMEVVAFGSDASRRARAVILPRWTEHALGTKEATVAIDFGTTNTHVAWTLRNMVRPTVMTIDQRDMQMALLNSPNDSTVSESARYDSFPGRLADFEVRLHHEFLPSIISMNSQFKFPMRTATSARPNLQPGEYLTLRNVNMSFIFGMDVHRPDEDISTNLKWSVGASENTRSRVEAFIVELLTIVKTKLILNDVDPGKSRIVWFRPLSFDEFTRGQFERIWRNAVERVFHGPHAVPQLQCLTESEAPYYYHEQAATIASSKPVLCIDIGGGSTDVVVFEKDAGNGGSMLPKIGTSFSFAGNALWGSGYDRVGHAQTGVVLKYGRWIDQHIAQINNDVLKKRIAGVYSELQKSRAASEELLNFFFSIDKHVGFTQELSLDGWVKCLVLVHYAAIVFHCAQVMRAAEMQPPEFLCLSGRGAQSIDILDSTGSKVHIATLTHAIFEEVYATPLERPIALRIASEPKEATCNGGMLKDPAVTGDPRPIVSIGDGSVTMNISERLTYSEIQAGTVDAVVANITKFTDCLLKLNRSVGFHNVFGIDVDFDNVVETINDRARDFIDLGLERHGYRENPTEAINETLFFYPLVQKLFDLGKNVES